ncbi:MAG: DUF928 domain-containing protein [Leptolyngbyaceae bacterium]|nr:DUF928 domain-containing protein [Leptolyngbyaceae bacterium]
MTLLSGLLATPSLARDFPRHGSTSSYSLARVIFKAPARQEDLISTRGSAKRGGTGQCPVDPGNSDQTSSRKTVEQPLTALVPIENLGLTMMARPTFWVYIPQTSSQTVEFLLEDRDGNEIYQTTSTLTSAAGVVSFTLPETAPALEIGKDYRWVVYLSCKPASPQDPFVGAWVRRIPTDSALMNTLRQKTPLARVATFAAAGIWHETLTNLVALKQAQPNNPTLARAWKDLLNSAGLEVLSTAPLQKINDAGATQVK